MHCDDQPVFNYYVEAANRTMELNERCPALVDLVVGRAAQHSFVPLGLLSRLGDFTSCRDFLLHTFYHTNSHRLTHVTYSKTTCGEKKKKVKRELCLAKLNSVINIYLESNRKIHQIFTLKLTQWRVFREALNTHWLPRNHIYNSRISRLERFGVVLQLFARATINFFLELCKLAGNVSSVAV